MIRRGFGGGTNAPFDSWARVKTQWPVFLSYLNLFFLWWLSFYRARVPELSSTTGIISPFFCLFFFSIGYRFAGEATNRTALV